MEKGRRRHIAVHEVIFNGQTLNMCILDIDDGIITGYHQFNAEEPMVEWVGGVMELRNDECGNIIAYRNGARFI